MIDPLVIYVEDHLSGARFAIELLGELRNRHAGKPLALFASEMLTEIEADTSVLEDFARLLGGTSGLKTVSAWIAEKVSRAKLRHDGVSLGTFETLELLTLGIQGKLALWRVLAFISPGDSRFTYLNLPELIERAECQHARAEIERLNSARETFSDHGEEQGP